MQGNVRQRGAASWELRVFIGRDPVTGRKRYVTKTVRGGKREANRELVTLLYSAQQGALSRSTATVADLLNAWFEHARPDLSPKTVRETRGYIDRNLIPALGGVRVDRLRADRIDAYYRALRSRRTRPLAPGTIRRIHGILRRALQQGVRWGWLNANPAAVASPPRIPASRLTPPRPEDIASLYRLAERVDPDLAVFILLAASTGARRSELIALRWSDIDLENRSVRIGRGIVLGLGGLVEKDTKTHSVRTVALDDATVSAMTIHRAGALARLAEAGFDWCSASFVFTPTVDGSTSWFPDSASRRFRRLCEAAKISGVRLHDLRHYVATRLLSDGVDVRTVAGRLGHRNAATTLNVYAHFLAETDRDAARQLGAIFTNALARSVDSGPEHGTRLQPVDDRR
jgi:integrase